VKRTFNLTIPYAFKMNKETDRVDKYRKVAGLKEVNILTDGLTIVMFLKPLKMRLIRCQSKNQ
jgi:hypothetical protein